MAPMFSAAVDSKRSAPRPAQSPTLSPTRSAITAGVAGIILRNAGFHFADQVSAHVSGLGIDTAAQLGKQGHERSAEAITDDQKR